MNKQEKQEAKKVVAELMEAGYSWQDATEQAGIAMGRAAAYSVWKKYREKGIDGLIDGRHGHRSKVNETVLEVIKDSYQKDACISSRTLQRMLKEQLNVSVSITHLNETRAAHGWTNQSGQNQKKRFVSAREPQGCC